MIIIDRYDLASVTESNIIMLCKQVDVTGQSASRWAYVQIKLCLLSLLLRLLFIMFQLFVLIHLTLLYIIMHGEQ